MNSIVEQRKRKNEREIIRQQKGGIKCRY